MAVTTKAKMGRPREFDTDQALERALLVFWEHGYEGATLTDLTTAMGITRPSMYAAFGNKEDLFGAVLKRYSDGPASYGTRALGERTARAVAAAFLHGSVDATTGRGRPHGCLGIQGALATSPADRRIRDILSEWRDDAQSRLAERFQRARDEGDLPSTSDPELLAQFLMTVSNGIAVQASSGTDPERLRKVADAALVNWPPL